MDNSTVIPASPANDNLAAGSGESPAKIASYLTQLNEVAARGASPQAKLDQAHQHKLVQMRLGMASSLFTALRVKHAPTAAHCLRVAIGCSSWAEQVGFNSQERDELEMSALLHDIGKIGVPDHVLLKPCKLEGEEVLEMERHRQYVQEILSGCCATPAILENVLYSAAWFDGTRHGFDRAGEQLPLGARMMSIVDAFDSMTTDSVYRRAYSRERALGELFNHAGSQFDPRLVKEFCEMLESDQMKLSANVARRWLRDLQPDAVNDTWTRNKPQIAVPAHNPVDNLFPQKLFDNIHDGIIFVDHGLKILLWNRAAERLTGISSASVQEKHWMPSLVAFHDEHDVDIPNEDCPVAHAIASGVQTLRRLTICGRNGERLAVDVHLVPIVGRDGSSHGAAILMRDASRQITLEERVQSLHEMATRDALTQVANRAEFDRVQTQFMEIHAETGVPVALIICDIDHFKKINDTFGHQAGDAALISFAGLLRGFCRDGDLVARYGGEEFAMLCHDCDNSTATARAEEIRRALSETGQAALHGKCITASFGVTEAQGGDTPVTMLRRADRALYQAKEGGRNQVVQLGTGMATETKVAGSGFFSWFKLPSFGGGTGGDDTLETDLITPVPMNMAAEKLRGFVADQKATIDSVKENHVLLSIDGENVPAFKRFGDRSVPFTIELKFEERFLELEGRRKCLAARTVIHVTIRPKRIRDRQRKDAMERAQHLLGSVKAYLMAHDFADAQVRV